MTLLTLFLNPGFLFVGVALISVPIIIHLINRMRFKRIRWAAMEFLLKAQKRTRRRLIIEQLILLMLRCMLIALTLFLVSKFVGCGESNMGGKPSLHIVLLDDTLSMKDTWKQDGETKNCFDVAKNEVIIKRIAKGLAQSKTNDSLIVLPVSKLEDPSFKIDDFTFRNLNNKEKLDKLTTVVGELKCSYLHVPMIKGVDKVKEIMGAAGDSIVTLHVISDYRAKDWARPAGENLTKELAALIEGKKGEVKIKVIDTCHPQRDANTSFPASRDNIGIKDVQARTRIAGKNMRVGFDVFIENFSGKDVNCVLIVRDGVTGKDLREIDFVPAGAFKVPGNSAEPTRISFEHRFNPDPKKNSTPFEHLTVRLATPQLAPLPNDALLDDNVRHVMVEVRDKIPIMIVDGAGAKGREEGKDSFYFYNALTSVESGSARAYKIDFADEISPLSVAAALEKVDLRKYAAVYLLNVESLNAKQVKILETYINDGGGVAFFMGPLVNKDAYNKFLYKEGKGLFPAPLASYYPPDGQPLLEPKDADTPQLLVRDDKFGNLSKTPIFNGVLEKPENRQWLNFLPVGRYFQINRSAWKRDEHVYELATLPNETPAATFGEAVAGIINGANVTELRKDVDLARYMLRLQKHLDEIKALAQVGSEAKSHQLARQIELMFNDKGDEKLKNSLTDFWTKSNSRIEALRTQFTDLRETVQYGDAYIVGRKFGKGKVVAVMSTAGKDWNDFASAPLASILYAPFITEMHNYLSNPASELNPTVGTKATVRVDAEQYAGKQLSLARFQIKGDTDQTQTRTEMGKQPGRVDGKELVFDLVRHNEPGLYVSELIEDGVPGAQPLASFGHVFNVDTSHEGRLHRLGQSELNTELLNKIGEKGVWRPDSPDDMLVAKTNDWSESPWLFLMILLVLVTEQALAVHLSFHIKSDDQDLRPAGLRG